MQRITDKDLENLVDRINRTLGTPMTYATANDDGKRTINIGNYHLDSAYGGVQLVQTVTIGGGVRVIIHGYGTKRELFNKMHAFLEGVRAAESEA